MSESLSQELSLEVFLKTPINSLFESTCKCFDSSKMLLKFLGASYVQDKIFFSL